MNQQQYNKTESSRQIVNHLLSLPVLSTFAQFDDLLKLRRICQNDYFECATLFTMSIFVLGSYVCSDLTLNHYIFGPAALTGHTK